MEKNYNQIKAEFRNYIINSPDFKSLNSDLDKRTNKGKTFEVDQEDQYSILLYDTETLIDDIKNRLPDNTEYIILIINSNFMGYEIELKCYINGKFVDIDENKWSRLMTVVHDNSEDLMSGYENAIMDITYTTWLEMRKKTTKAIFDINESNLNNDIKNQFVKFVTSLPYYNDNNRQIYEERDRHSLQVGYYINELFNSDILKPIHNYPGKTEVPSNIEYFIMSDFGYFGGHKKEFFVYDVNDGFRIPTKDENEFIVKNDSSQQFSSGNFESLFSMDHEDWLKTQSKVDTLFNNINESNIKVITSFSKFKNTL